MCDNTSFCVFNTNNYICNLFSLNICVRITFLCNSICVWNTSCNSFCVCITPFVMTCTSQNYSRCVMYTSCRFVPLAVNTYVLYRNVEAHNIHVIFSTKYSWCYIMLVRFLYYSRQRVSHVCYCICHTKYVYRYSV